MIVIARDSNRKNKAVPADPGCSGVPGFPYTPIDSFRDPYKSYWKAISLPKVHLISCNTGSCTLYALILGRYAF